jgi:hypothetical protein
MPYPNRPIYPMFIMLLISVVVMSGCKKDPMDKYNVGRLNNVFTWRCNHHIRLGSYLDSTYRENDTTFGIAVINNSTINVLNTTLHYKQASSDVSTLVYDNIQRAGQSGAIILKYDYVSNSIVLLQITSSSSGGENGYIYSTP